MRQRARGHLQHRLARDRALRVERGGRNAEHLHLGFVGIGDEAAIDHGGRPGYVGERGDDQAAGAAFRRRQHDAALLAGPEQSDSEFGVAHAGTSPG
jgi:hypothetical protein